MLLPIKKKIQIKQAMKINKQLTKEQESKNKEIHETPKIESLQGDVIEDTPSKPSSDNIKEETKDIDSMFQALIDSGDNCQDEKNKDSNKSMDKQNIK